MAGIADLLAAAGSANNGYQAGQAQKIAQALNAIRLSQAQNQQAGQGFLGDAMADPASANIPQAPQGAIPGQTPMPGQPSQPMQRPPAPGPANLPAPPMNPQQTPQPQGAAPAAPAPAATAQQLQGRLTLQQLAQFIKAKNPGVNGQQLFYAMDSAKDFLIPQQKAEFEQVREQYMQKREQLIDSQIGLNGAKTVAEPVKAGASKERADAFASGEARKEDGEKRRTDKEAFDEGYKTDAKELDEVRSEINKMGVPAADSPQYKAYQELASKRDAIFNRMDAARKKNPKLPSIVKAVNDASGQAKTGETGDPTLKIGGGAGTKDNPIQATTQADIDNAPAGAVLSIDGKLYTK